MSNGIVELTCADGRVLQYDAGESLYALVAWGDMRWDLRWTSVNTVKPQSWINTGGSCLATELQTWPSS